MIETIKYKENKNVFSAFVGVNLSYRYINDLISFDNKRFKEFISDIYPQKLTISVTTESTLVASYLCFSPEIKVTI